MRESLLRVTSTPSEEFKVIGMSMNADWVAYTNILAQLFRYISESRWKVFISFGGLKTSFMLSMSIEDSVRSRSSLSSSSSHIE